MQQAQLNRCTDIGKLISGIGFSDSISVSAMIADVLLVPFEYNALHTLFWSVQMSCSTSERTKQ